MWCFRVQGSRSHDEAADPILEPGITNLNPNPWQKVEPSNFRMVYENRRTLLGS